MSNRTFILQAIKNLVPVDAAFSIEGEEIYDNLKWLDTNYPKPTKDVVESEANRLIAEWNATEYQRKRVTQYPSLSELADAIYWQQQGDNSKMTAYLAKVAAVKEEFPK
jgi:hypothetical protein